MSVAPTVSAIITTFNYGRYVTDAVNSALSQTLAPTEIIVIDDGSTDDTQLRLEPFLDRIRYVRQENQGVDAARNHGLALSRGDYVNFIDADDLWHARKLEAQVAFLAAHPETRVLATGVTINRRDMQTTFEPCIPLPDPQRVSIDELVVRSRFALSSALIRRDCFETVGNYRANICGAEDRDLWIRLAAHFEILLLDLPLTYYRVHGQNLSATAARMDAVDHRMLTAVFSEIDALRRRKLLRRKAFSYAATMSAFLHTDAGNQRMAMWRVLQSLALWPFKFEKHDNRSPFYRMKMLAVFAMRAAGLKARHVQPVAEEHHYA